MVIDLKSFRNAVHGTAAFNYLNERSAGARRGQGISLVYASGVCRTIYSAAGLIFCTTVSPTKAKSGAPSPSLLLYNFPSYSTVA